MNMWRLLKTFVGSMPKDYVVFANCKGKTAMVVSDGWTVMEYKFSNPKPHGNICVHFTELFNVIHPHKKADIQLDGNNVLVKLPNSKERIVLRGKRCNEFCSDEVVDKSKGILVNISSIIKQFDKISRVAFMPPNDRYNVMFFSSSDEEQADLVMISHPFFHAFTHLPQPFPFECVVNYNSFCHIAKMLKLLKVESAYALFEDDNNELYIWTDDVLFGTQALPKVEFYFKPFEITTKIGEFVVENDIVAKANAKALQINDVTYNIPHDFSGQLILSKRRLSHLKGKTCEVYCGSSELVLRIEDVSIRPKQLRGEWHGLYRPDPSNPFVI